MTPITAPPPLRARLREVLEVQALRAEGEAQHVAGQRDAAVDRLEEALELLGGND